MDNRWCHSPLTSPSSPPRGASFHVPFRGPNLALSVQKPKTGSFCSKHNLHAGDLTTIKSPEPSLVWTSREAQTWTQGQMGAKVRIMVAICGAARPTGSWSKVRKENHPAAKLRWFQELKFPNFAKERAEGREGQESTYNGSGLAE